MLKIGEFARLTGVTVKTLRHYARLGLLKPARVDRFTGYRYYSLEQRETLERIREMQGMGFTLEQVKHLLQREVQEEEWKELLTRKRLELIQRLRADQTRLSLVDLRLEHTGTHNGKDAEMEAKLVNKPAMVVVGMRYQGKNLNNEIAGLWGRFNQRSSEIKHIQPEAAYGVCIMAEGLPEGEFEYIAGFAVKQIDALPEGMVVRIIPAYTYAVFAHRGGHEGLKQTYHNIYNVWLKEMGYQPISPLDMEVYTDEFKDFAPDSVFYIYVPVAKV